MWLKSSSKPIGIQPFFNLFFFFGGGVYSKPIYERLIQRFQSNSTELVKNFYLDIQDSDLVRICHGFTLSTYLRLNVQKCLMLFFLNIVYSTIRRGQAQMMMGWEGRRWMRHNVQGSQHPSQHPPWLILHWLNCTDMKNYRNVSRMLVLGHRRIINCYVMTCTCKIWYAF